MIDMLEFIIDLARDCHFGRAAEACGVSQPTLSSGIKQLEDSFGVLLVNRGSRFGGFTPEGERVLDWARRIVGDARAMRQEIEALLQRKVFLKLWVKVDEDWTRDAERARRLTRDPG